MDKPSDQSCNQFTFNLLAIHITMTMVIADTATTSALDEPFKSSPLAKFPKTPSIAPVEITAIKFPRLPTPLLATVACVFANVFVKNTVNNSQPNPPKHKVHTTVVYAFS